MRIRILPLAASLLGVTAFAQVNKPISVGEPDADTSPAGELATFKILDGFEVNLFASEEDGVPNPLIIRWDERGRMWCVCPLSYPQPVPGKPLEDKILILEDSDGDGKADKRTVFADGLRMPTGLELAPAKSPKGHSVYVGEGEKLVLMHDLDGDDVMDEKEVVFSGFGTGDTHQNINSFIWSPSGALVMHQGLHCYSKVVTAWGVETLYGAGFWHYWPQTGKLEAFPTGMPLNGWGTAFTDAGEPVMVAGAAGMYWSKPMEISTSHTDVSGGNKAAKDGQVHGIPHFLIERFQLPYGGQMLKTEGLRKFCGIDIAGSSHWPDAMQGELLTGGFFENAIFRYQVKPDPEFPSGIVAEEQVPLITSSSIAFRPVDVRFGPDGALYIADWYDPIIGHYQASFRHPNRDHAHGRIWRVVAKGREKAKPTDGRWASYQQHLQNVYKLAEPTETEYRRRADLVMDDSPRQRVEGVVAAAKLKSIDGIRLALRALDKPMDSYIERALWLTVQSSTRYWKPLTLEFLKELAPAHIAFLIKREGSKEVRTAAQEMLAAGGLPESVKLGLELALAKEDKSLSGLLPEEQTRLQQAAKDADKLEALAGSKTASPKLCTAALTKLAAVDAARAGRFAAARLNEMKSVATMQALLGPVLVVDKATQALTEALKAAPCSADAAKLVISVLTSTGRNDAALSAVLSGALGGKNAQPSYDPAWVNALAAEVKSAGNPERGKAGFASTLTNCTACHAIAKKGGTIGPELDAVGRGIPVELLIEAVVWPNRQIKEGYIATTVSTQDGRTLTGYKVSDTNGELKLRDFTASTLHVLQSAEIKTRQESASLMPEGLITLMTREELRDLIAYLTTLGH